MTTIQVLIVDADVLVRQALARVAEGVDDITVVGIVSTPEAAYNVLGAAGTVDVILFDVEGVAGDGLAALDDMLQRHPEVPVVVLSSRSEDGAQLGIRALERGAADCITKPESLANVIFALRHFQKRLPPIVRAVAGTLNAAAPDVVPAGQGAEGEPARIEGLAMGACTGGPAVLFTVLPQLPASFPVPIFIAQHLPSKFTAALAERLDARCALTVCEAATGVVPKAGQVWVAPGGYHLDVRREGQQIALRTHRGSRQHKCRPSIDVLFTSVADAYGARALGVVLSGFGEDGVDGARRIREAGGRIVIQDRQHAQVTALPDAVLSAGLVDEVAPLSALADVLIRRASAGRDEAMPTAWQAGGDGASIAPRRRGRSAPTMNSPHVPKKE